MLYGWLSDVGGRGLDKGEYSCATYEDVFQVLVADTAFAKQTVNLSVLV